MSDDLLQSVLRTLLQIADRTLDAAHSVSNGVLGSPPVAPAARRAHGLADQFGDLASTLGDQFADVADQLGDRFGDVSGVADQVNNAWQAAVPAQFGDRAAAMSGAATELMSAITANRSMVEDVIRTEIEGQLHRVGLASGGELTAALAEVDRLREDNARLQRALAHLRSADDVPAADPAQSAATKGAGPGTPTRPVVSRSALREAAMRQAAQAASDGPPAAEAAAEQPVATTQAPMKKAAARKAPTKHAPATKATAQKSTLKKAPTKKTAAQKPAPRKTAATKAPAKSIATKKAAKESPAKSPAKKSTAKKAAPSTGSSS